MTFSVGDRVRIREGTRFYKGTFLNPINVKGVITKICDHGNLPILVDWDNGCHNSYHEKDLCGAEPKSLEELL